MKERTEKILSVLIELYAKQNGIRVDYIIDIPDPISEK